MTETTKKTSRGAIIYDADLFDTVSDDMFRITGWQQVGRVQGSLRAAGRGNTAIVSNGADQFVLRRYLRGGLIGKLIKNTYFWAGEDETRAFVEWRLLRKLIAKGLNVPIPAAARYQKLAMFYTAELLTVRIDNIQSLADRLLERPGSAAFWQSLGASINVFHEAGVYHADMNAYNVQVDADDQLWLLDFDRGKLSPEGTWKQETLARLHRSLQKIKTLDRRVNFRAADWEQFLEGYFNASKSE